MFFLIACVPLAIATNLDDRIKWTAPKNISDTNLMLDLKTFTNLGHGWPNNTDGDTRRQIPMNFYNPSQRKLNSKILDMMKQALYSSQNRMRDTSPVLEKYKEDPSLRMMFILSRLNQLTIDIRRIYTLAVRRRLNYRVFDHITLYQHCLRKYIDIIYIVEYAISLHTEYMKIYSQIVQ